MLDIIIGFFTYLFAVYGIISFIAGIADLIYCKKVKRKNIKLVLIVKNQEDTIEGVVRSLYINDYPGRIMSDRGLTVIDMGSQDSTSEVLDRLKREYGSLEVYSQNQKSCVFENFNDRQIPIT